MPRFFTVTSFRGALVRHLQLAWLLPLVACNAGDLSSFLATGRCDSSGSCAAGYVCDERNGQCVSAGSLLNGAGGENGSSGASSVNSFAGTSNSSSGGRPNVGGATTGGVAPTGGMVGTGGSTACLQDGCPCDNGLVHCGGECVDIKSNTTHCGTCSNRCELGAVTLVCGQEFPGVCGCAGDDTRCGGQAGANKCDKSLGICNCNGVDCARGEVCRTGSNGVDMCSCDATRTCATGQTCCQGQGCLDLNVLTDNCGTCGHACPTGFYCGNGSCHCRNAPSCGDPNTDTCSSTGFCVCNGTVCAAGQRCIAIGQCG